jgi:structural maintenance of chromosome 4
LAILVFIRMRKDLFLKSIRIKNFKSYKNLTEAGPFHPKINIIVGPNGTGKSNFLDSILFVIGKRAGQLRFRKLSDMINLKNIKKNRFGSVSLLFSENLKNFINRKELFSEIVFSRQVFYDNLSYYYLNGKEISFFNLINCLKVIGICVKNDRFLIQQGEIEKISQMKSKNGFSSEVGLLE